MLKSQERRLVITFHTTAGAIALEKLCKSKGIPGRLVPVPRSITSDCGIAWSMALEYRAAMEKAIADRELEIVGFHEVLL
jgi:hypothetical protein